MPEANPATHPAQQPMALRHLEQGGDGLAAHDPEITCVNGNLNVGEQVESPVKQFRSQQFEEALTRARAPHSVNHIVAGLKNPHHLHEHLGRILKVGIH